jgi:hypothetical protein
MDPIPSPFLCPIHSRVRTAKNHRNIGGWLSDKDHSDATADIYSLIAVTHRFRETVNDAIPDRPGLHLVTDGVA